MAQHMQLQAIGDRGAAVVDEVEQEVGDQGAVGPVQISGRFVSEQQFGADRQGAGDRQATVIQHGLRRGKDPFGARQEQGDGEA